MNFKKYKCMFLCGLLVANIQADQSVNTSDNKATLTEIDSGGIWPTFVVKKVINASPESVAALFWDVERSPEYMPNCLRVKEVSSVGRTSVANYTLAMPFFMPDEVYQATNKVSVSSANPSYYKISWDVGASIYSQKAIGDISIEPYGSGNKTSLVTYKNTVTPSSKIAKLLKSSAAKETVDALNALNDQILKENQTTIAKQIAALNKSLKSN